MSRAREEGSQTNRRSAGARQCPSAPFDAKGAVVFGIVAGSAREPRVRYLPRVLVASPDLSRQLAPAEPEEVFRASAPCVRRRCVHFREERCELASRVVNLLPMVTAEAPPCAIRAVCTWWLQQGTAACLRCPQLARVLHGAGGAARQAAGCSEALEREEEEVFARGQI